ncbi:MAG: hypothetical protein FD181_2669 [Prolixibacteraceae bacterium]|nr:MAG: hypothetical protein FD181_2669 [Prolixibacteraceae bacterium]
MSNRLICICNFVEKKEIKLLFRKGAESTVDIQNLTRAGTSCGRCLPLIDELVAQHQTEKPKIIQKEQDFGL